MIRECTHSGCPICSHRRWCGQCDDGLILCKRPPTPRDVAGYEFRGMAKDGVTGMYVEHGRAGAGPRIMQVEEAASSPGNRDGDAPLDAKQIAARQAEFVAAFGAAQRAKLAQLLSLPVSALDAIPIGW